MSSSFSGIKRGRKRVAAKSVFTCSCGKDFPRNEHLLRHERSHNGERPFGCLHDGCGNSFSRFDNMMPHFRHHFGFPRTREGAKRAEREIHLLRGSSVNELKRMSREKLRAISPPNSSISTIPSPSSQTSKGIPFNSTSSSPLDSSSLSQKHTEANSKKSTAKINNQRNQNVVFEIDSQGEMQFLGMTIAATLISPASSTNVIKSSSLPSSSALSSPLSSPPFPPNLQQFDQQLLRRFQGPL